MTHRKNSCLFLLCGRHFKILWIVYLIGGLYSISKLCLCLYCMYCSVSYWEKHQRKGVSLLTISAQVVHIPICSLCSIFYLVGLYHSHSFSVQQLFQFLIKKSAKMCYTPALFVSISLQFVHHDLIHGHLFGRSTNGIRVSIPSFLFNQVGSFVSS